MQIYKPVCRETGCSRRLFPPALEHPLTHSSDRPPRHTAGTGPQPQRGRAADLQPRLRGRGLLQLRGQLLLALLCPAPHGPPSAASRARRPRVAARVPERTSHTHQLHTRPKLLPCWHQLVRGIA